MVEQDYCSLLHLHHHKAINNKQRYFCFSSSQYCNQQIIHHWKEDCMRYHATMTMTMTHTKTKTQTKTKTGGTLSTVIELANLLQVFSHVPAHSQDPLGCTAKLFREKGSLSSANHLPCFQKESAIWENKHFACWQCSPTFHPLESAHVYVVWHYNKFQEILSLWPFMSSQMWTLVVKLITTAAEL